jgi:cellulose synthase/poly-beta-1,6-N-acetylglucosamine synthase-like glycosyltransferase
MIAWVGLTISAAIVLYILFGYPIALALSRGTRRHVAKDLNFRCTVTLIMTVYNGANFLRKKLDSILNLGYPAELLQILVVSDGSTDDTEAIASEYTDRGVELIRAAQHVGKAACLNLAMARARGSILFFTDVRQPLHGRALSHLVANFADPTVGAVTGELQLLPGDNGEHRDMGVYWKYELWARRKHSQIDSTFTTTGCLYALRRWLTTKLPADTISDDAVLSLNAFFLGYRVVVDPEAIAFDYPALPGTEFRRRWRNLAGLWQLHARTPALFSSANRMRWHFLSHKFARLALPWAFLCGVGCLAWLPPSTWRTVVFLITGLLLGIAMADRWVPNWLPLKRVSSPLRTFVRMNIASISGIAVFVMPARNFWKPTQTLIDERGIS